MVIKHRSTRHRLFGGVAPVALALAAGFILSPMARADDQADPPARVGRISVIQGTVSFHPSPDDQWGPAVVNYPVAASTALWADDNAEAQVEIGAARIRLDADTELDIVQLDDQNVVLSVPQGRIDISLHGRQNDETYDIQTPRGDVDLLADGSYRVFSGTDSDPTRVATFAGQAQLAGQSSQITIGINQEMTATPGTTVGYAVAAASEDAFDHTFFNDVEKIYAHPAPAYVPHMPGVAALNEYGAWRDDASYGHVWIPTSVAPGWQPYHAGHWGYIAPWGYTWIDDAPWGFAPFHYGRWVQVGGAWGWLPVERGVTVEAAYRPVYSPAMVTFIGNPAALTVGIGVGVGVAASVGWVPLGPGEPFHPWYHASNNYVRNTNIVNVNKTVITNITNNTVINNTTYVNQRAATVVPANAFSGGRPIQQAALKIPPAALAKPIQAASPEEVQSKVLPKPEAVAVVGGGAKPAHVPPPPKLQMKHPAPASAAAFHANPPPANAGLDKAGAVGRPDAAGKPGEAKAQPAEPLKPGAKPGEAPKPGEMAKPGETAKPGEVAKPGDKAKPGEMAKPGEPKAPADAAAPGKPAKPGEMAKPAEAAKPGEPKTPADAAAPGKPAKPGEPVKPGPVAKPGRPAEGVTKPGDDAKPARPAEPKEVAKPGTAPHPGPVAKPEDSAAPTARPKPGMARPTPDQAKPADAATPPKPARPAPAARPDNTAAPKPPNAAPRPNKPAAPQAQTPGQDKPKVDRKPNKNDKNPNDNNPDSGH